MNDNPKYSICMCNYNMARTIEAALRSILEQIDPKNYEVVLVDDGSKDDSVQIVKKLQQDFSCLRLICLKRDSKRKLGLTRNISIKEAKGEYVLLHLDCDDITAPHIQDFVTIFHKIEKNFRKDFLLSGDPINMGKRDFLLSIGPYQNILRGEDRDLWSRLRDQNALIKLNHKSLKTRLPHTFSERIKRFFYYTFNIIENDFRLNPSLSFWSFLCHQFKHKKFKFIIARISIAPFAWISFHLRNKETLIQRKTPLQEKKTNCIKSYPQTMEGLSLPTTWHDLSPNAKNIFND